MDLLWDHSPSDYFNALLPMPDSTLFFLSLLLFSKIPSDFCIPFDAFTVHLRSSERQITGTSSLAVY